MTQEPDEQALPTDQSSDESSDQTTAPDDGSRGPSDQPRPVKDPLRRSRVSGTWLAVVVLLVVLILLAVFVLQNTEQVTISFFGWDGRAPLAAALLIAAAGGLLLAVAAGSLRILQLRRRVRRAHREPA